MSFPRASFPLAVLLVMALGCGGDSPTKPISVSVEPATATVAIGQTRQFHATVTGTTNQGITWTVDGGVTNGAVDSSGLYTAPVIVPVSPTVTVRATSIANGTKSGTAAVTITVPPVTVSIDPMTAAVEVGGTQPFSATVTGATNTAVTWSVDGGAANGTIDATGLYTAPQVVPGSGTAAVVATSVADATARAAATVTVLAAPPPMEFAIVPAGAFNMGDFTSYCGKSSYYVVFTEDIYLGQTEVTNRQYLEMVQWAYDHGYVEATATSATDAMGSSEEILDLDIEGCEIEFSDGTFRLRDAGHGLNPEHPVKRVTWFGAAAFCDWMSLKEGLAPAYDHGTWQCNGGDPYRAQGYRLPTDAEWEYAAQYNDARTYPWGNQEPTCDRANYDGCNDDWTEPVASQSAGAEKVIAGKGLYDMAGNSAEWCNDWFQCEASPSVADPPGPTTGTYRVVRGGNYRSNTDPLHCALRSYTRANASPSLGFRIARTVNP